MTPRRRHADLRLRLAGVVLLVVAAVGAAVHVGVGQASARERQRQASDARAYFETRMRSLDEGWRATAFALGQQLQLWLAAPPQLADERRDARARMWLIAVLDQSDFTHAQLRDEADAVLLQFGTRSQAVMPAQAVRAGGLDWTWNAADATIYRVVDGGPVRLGGQPARLLLYAPLDHALLRRLRRCERTQRARVGP